MTTAIVVGDTAPDFAYSPAAGGQRRLAELWESGPALVLWLRHFG